MRIIGKRFLYAYDDETRSLRHRKYKTTTFTKTNETKKGKRIPFHPKIQKANIQSNTILTLLYAWE